MKVFLVLVVLVTGLGFGIHVMSQKEGSLADRLVDRFDEIVDEQPVGVSEQRRALAEDDVTKVAGLVLQHARAGRYPTRLDGLGFKVASGRNLEEGNHLDAYARTKAGFRVCVVNVSGAWAAWETTRQTSGVVATGTTGGECSYG